MKKLFASLLTVAMLSASALPVFADATSIDNDNNKAENKVEGDYSIGVNGTLSSSGSTDKYVISADISWEGMTFTYTAGSTVYEPKDHTNKSEPGKWKEDKASITVKNHSNVGIDASFKFEKAQGVTTTGTFYTKSGTTYTAISNEDDQRFTLDSADGKTRNDTDAALDESPTNTIYFGVSGDGVDSSKTLGTITVKIAKDTSVKTYEDLVASLNKIKTTGGTVRLGADITIPANEELNNMQAMYVTSESGTVVLDLGGHTVTGIIIVASNTTSDVVIQNGTLEYEYVGNVEVGTDAGVVMVAQGNAEFKNVTINTTNIVALFSYGNSTLITDSTFNGGFEVDGVTCTIRAKNNLTLSGEVTVKNKVRMDNSDWCLTIKSGCQYKIGGASTATTVDADTTYNSSTSTSDPLPWLVLVP